jgi:hypothetical protein
MDGNGPVSHSNMNHAHRSLTVILTEPWHWRSCENSIFQNDKWPQTRSWDGKLTLRNFSVTEQDVNVYVVRINAFHANIDVTEKNPIFWGFNIKIYLKNKDLFKYMFMLKPKQLFLYQLYIYMIVKYANKLKHDQYQITNKRLFN